MNGLVTVPFLPVTGKKIFGNDEVGDKAYSSILIIYSFLRDLVFLYF